MIKMTFKSDISPHRVNVWIDKLMNAANIIESYPIPKGLFQKEINELRTISQEMSAIVKIEFEDNK